jgi:carbon storage regulator CsrA
MLILTRKVGEAITLDGPGEVVILKAAGRSVVVGIKAPATTQIRRTELERNGNGERERAGEARS